MVYPTEPVVLGVRASGSTRTGVTSQRLKNPENRTPRGDEVTNRVIM